MQFFLNFCQATFVFTAFVFATLVVYTVRMMNGSSSDLDPQMIVIIALYVWKMAHPLVLEELSYHLQSWSVCVIHEYAGGEPCEYDIERPDNGGEYEYTKHEGERNGYPSEGLLLVGVWVCCLLCRFFSLPFTTFLPSHDTLFPSIACHCRSWPQRQFHFHLSP